MDQDQMTLTAADKEYLYATFVQQNNCIDRHEALDNIISGIKTNEALTAQRVGLLCWLTGAEVTAIIGALVTAFFKLILK